MLEFPRWKYVLVVLVVAVGLLLALPTVFGTEPALQLARKDHAAITASERTAVEQLLSSHHVAVSRSYVTGERMTVAFNTVAAQLQARDLIDARFSGTYTSALADAPREPGWMLAMGLRPMSLGLDLRGGLYLLYQVDVRQAVAQLLDSYAQSFRDALHNAHLPYTNVSAFRSGQNAFADGVRITLASGANAASALAALKKVDNTLSFTTVTLPSGRAIDMVLTASQIRQREQYAVEQNRTTLMNRVNQLGVSEPIVQQQGIDRIAVQLPGVQNEAEVKNLLGQVATLEFHLVDSTDSAQQAAASGIAPLGTRLYKDRQGQPVLLYRQAIATGDEITSATTSASNQGPAVSVQLDSRGAASMLRTTRLNVGHLMAVVYIVTNREAVEVNGKKVDREVTTQTVVNQATIQGVFGPQFQVTGLTPGQAQDLALLLRSGSLAAPIYVVEEQAIGPSLGQDNINKGIDALEFGMLAVFVFMAIYYHAFGLVADAVLIANVVLLTALLALLRASLSLPGIAGIILTVGIAVDANVLIYERIREELRNGVSPQTAIRAGFDKAFSAIADSNVTALIAGLALYVIGTGAIRGFAIVLTLGIVTSMFTSLLGSRAMITLMYGRRKKVARLSIG